MKYIILLLLLSACTKPCDSTKWGVFAPRPGDNRPTWTHHCEGRALNKLYDETHDKKWNRNY